MKITFRLNPLASLATIAFRFFLVKLNKYTDTDNDDRTGKTQNNIVKIS